MQEILVKTLMSQEVKCLGSNETLRSAIELMLKEHLSCVVITDNASPVGIITERDLVKILLVKDKEKIFGQTASQFMSSPVITLNQDESLFDALVVSQAEKVRHLPVVDDNRLVGILTQTDLVNAHHHVVEIQTDIIEQSIQNKTRELQEANQELQALSMEDHLLEIGNRRAMEVDLNHTHASLLRYKRSYSIVLIDVDYFKKYNDHYGHSIGDDALKAIAELLKNAVRKSDRVYRYGGEELLLLLPDTDAKNAQVLSQRLVQALYDLNIPHCESPFERLTISAGVSAAMSGDSVKEDWAKVVEDADDCMYKSKQDGRNRSSFKD